LIAGAAGFIAISSLACALTALRQGCAVEPYVWVDNPLAASPAASFAWHLVLALIFASAATLSLYGRELAIVRLGVAAVLGLVGLIAVKDIAVFYGLLAANHIQSSSPLPLSTCVLALLSGLAVAVCRRRTGNAIRLRSALLDLLGGVSGALAIVLLHLVTFGATNYTRAADVAVVLGAKVYSDGTPSTSLADRLDTGIELYKAGYVRYLLMTGGTGVEGCNEALAMRDYATAAGVLEHDILVDTDGMNTLASAQNCRTILSERQLHSVLLVSHYFHLARCKMAFADQGIRCTTVPARMSRRLVYEPFFLFRECVAYPLYCMKRPLRNLGDD
jgi:vancomycin permeability regulator SanA